MLFKMGFSSTMNRTCQLEDGTDSVTSPGTVGLNLPVIYVILCTTADSLYDLKSVSKR
jgi:hypothetical protein